MLAKSNTNFLPAYDNPHSISLANTISNDVDIYSPFIRNSQREMLSEGLQGLSGITDMFTNLSPVQLALGGIGLYFAYKKFWKK